MTWLRGVIESWRSGTRRSQVAALALLVVGVGGSLAVSLRNYDLFPLTAYFVWLLLGMVLLRYGPLLVLVAAVSLAALGAILSAGPLTGARASASVAFAVSVALVLYVSSRQRSGLPGPLSEALLADLRDRLNAQGRVPPLPDGWHFQTAMLAAYGVGYAGDFMVADLDEDDHRLELVLVDVVGKGVKAAPAALMLAGALGGLVGALSGTDLLRAANDFLLRQNSDETFATAVHVSIDLVGGGYTIVSAGHPPALRWCPTDRQWVVDSSRGLALGILRHPELEASHGVLEPGQALLFYTDGVVEARGGDIEDGIAWLQDTAAAAITKGTAGAARRVIRQVPRGDDDRALLILSRTAV